MSSSPLLEGSANNINWGFLQSKCLENPFSNDLIKRHLIMHCKQHSLPPRKRSSIKCLPKERITVSLYTLTYVTP